MTASKSFERGKKVRIKQIEKIRKHKSKKERDPKNEDQEISVESLLEYKQTKEALNFFVNTFSSRVDEFKIAYENVIYTKDMMSLTILLIQFWV